MKNLLLLPVCLFTLNSFASDLPLLGKYQGLDSKGDECTLDVLEVVTDKKEIRKNMRGEINDHTMMDDSFTPGLAVRVRVNKTLKVRNIYSREDLGAKYHPGEENLLSNASGLFPLPFFWFLDTKFNAAGEVVEYEFDRLPVYRHIQCKNMKKIN
ncbi:MAG: hypothetical protein ACOYL6_19065 [Bacteriovoracaceae bacterium]